MQTLNLPTYSFKIKSEGQRKLIFDEIRKKYVALTPEEWVRQHFIMYLADEKSYPLSLISIEGKVNVNNLSLRSDIVLYNRNAKPLMIVECKAPSVKITQDVFEQIARYNTSLKVDYLTVTNGLQHFCCHINYESKTYDFLKDIPDYKDVTGGED